MDKSKEYIKMCEKAVEIQKTYYDKKDGMPTLRNKLEVGDYMIHKTLTGSCDYITPYIFRADIHGNIREPEMYDVWLPRQDQLQGMIVNTQIEPSKYKNTFWVLQQFYKFVKDGEGYWHSFDNCPYPHPSMEQLWLAFVMRKKFNKTWDGEKWEVME